MSDETFAALLELFGPLPRQGPGSRAATLRALGLVGELPARPRVIDFGCGSGAATLVLAQALPEMTIVAVDVAAPLLERLREQVEALALGERVELVQASMLEVDRLPDDVDLAWSEGAIYNVGIEAALRAWSPKLRPGAAVVFSELVYFVPEAERPSELREFWAKGYPSMRDEAGVRAAIASAGYRWVTDFRLEREAWWTDFYAPLARRCEALRSNASASLAEAIDESEHELALHRRYGDRYGYTYFVLRSAGGRN